MYVCMARSYLLPTGTWQKQYTRWVGRINKRVAHLKYDLKSMEFKYSNLKENSRITSDLGRMEQRLYEKMKWKMTFKSEITYKSANRWMPHETIWIPEIKVENWKFSRRGNKIDNHLLWIILLIHQAIF